MLTDPLTGVYSRATLERRLHEEIERAQRYADPFSMVLLDLDYYKSVNDAFGHQRGDQVLAEFAQRLRVMVRKSDIIFRYGGDEFLLLLPHTNKNQAVYLAQRLLDGVREAPFPGNPPLSLSISLGVSSFPDDAHNPEALFEKADQRHYEAKRRGRSRVIGEDSGEKPLLPFDEDARLIERDAALEALHRFLADLGEARRGVLAITGPAGSGRRRFLSEVGKVARLQGFEVVSLRGGPALKTRPFGDLAEVVKNWSTLPPPSVGEQAFSLALERLIRDKGRSGLFFTIDNLHETDWSTQELLRSLLLSSTLPFLLAVAFTSETAAARQVIPPGAPLVELVELHALSPEGARIWLRTLLQWEPPAEFAGWLYEETAGLPTYLQAAVTELVERRVLEKANSGWVFTSNYKDLALKEKLGLRFSLPPNNLPAALTGFVGRETEIQAATGMLQSGRLLTLCGPGGMGKTRLALQVAAEVLRQFPQGVYWVPLAQLGAPEYVPGAIAAALQFDFYSREEPEVQLFNFLREKQALLVLDNFEHLVQAAGFVSRLLESAPQVRVLVTSRERLNLRGESVLVLQGMDVPPGLPAEAIETYSAVQLFMQSARRLDPAFELDAPGKAAVIRICRLVEGLPLGIELAAAWVRMLTCPEIAAEIEQNLDFLASPLRDAPERHRSLRAVFEHSWNLLAEGERRALAALSVFRGGFRREAAAKVAGASLAALSQLMDRSLLRRSSSGRYDLHDTLLPFAIDKLSEDQAACDQAHELHCRYYIGLLGRQEPALRGDRQKAALEEIGEEIENVRLAWRWALDHARLEALEPSLNSLFSFYEIRGLLLEGEQAFRSAEECLRLLPPPAPGGEAQYSSLLGRILCRRGVFNFRLGNYDLAEQLFATSLEISGEQQQLAEMALALLKLGALHDELGMYDQARTECQRSLELYRRLDDRRGMGRAANQLGSIAYQQGEFRRAGDHHRQSLQVFRQENDPWGLASTLINLGNVESELGEYHQARQYYREALALCEEIGARTGVATTLNNLGDIARENGDYREARQYLSRSLDIYSEVGDRYGMSIALGNLGEVAYHQGAYEEARHYLSQSQEIAQQTGNLLQLAYARTHLGMVACALGENSAAQDFFFLALPLALENQAIPLALEALVGVATLLSKGHNKQKAAEILGFAIAHPAMMKAARERAEILAAALEAELPPHALRLTPPGGGQPSIEDIVQEIMLKEELE